MLDQARRRILCIRAHRDMSGAPESVAPVDWTATLAQHAEVGVMEKDGDLAALCGEVQPDLIVLEGPSQVRPLPVAIANPRACPDIPRVLMLTGEPFDTLRGLAMRMADALGVETIFVPGEAHRQHMPELASRLCHLAPFAANLDPYADQELERIIPVTVLDSNIEPGLHPWRTTLLAEVRLALPTLAYTRGTTDAARLAFPLPAEARAGLINQSWFCAADTTRFDRVSPDHLNIPAAGAVLVAPPSDALAAYGFADMENCLMGEGADLVRKIDHVSRTPSDYDRIRKAGTALVQRRYGGTASHALLGWLDCRKRLKPGQIVQQVDRYGPFRAVTPTFSTPSVLAAPARDSVMTQALRQGQTAILTGEALMEALATIDEIARSCPQVAEPLFLLSILALLNGNAVEAAMGIGSRAETLGARDERLAALDPVETAWLLLVARLIGHAPLESAMREQASVLRHLSLRRMFWLLDADASDISVDASLLEHRPDDLPSVHWLGQEDFTQWADLVRRALMANRASPGQAAVARRLLAAA